MPGGFVSIPEAYADVIAVDGADGLRLRLYRLRGPRAGRPPLLFGHACGFAAGSYLPLLLALTEFADVFAFDARGHGGSAAPTDDLAIYTPDHYARDLVRLGEAVCRQTGASAVAYVGHSLGAAAMLRLGCFHPESFAAGPWRSLMLFEPPIFPPPDRPEYTEAVAKDRELIRRTDGRAARWPSRETFIDAVNGRGAFRHFSFAFLAAHAEATLRPAPDEVGYALCCPPAVEAATYRGFGDDSTFRALPGFPRDLPLHLVAGDAADPDARSWVTLIAPVLAARLGVGLAGHGHRRFTALAGRGHLMIQEDSEMTRRLIHDWLASSWNP